MSCTFCFIWWRNAKNGHLNAFKSKRVPHFLFIFLIKLVAVSVECLEGLQPQVAKPLYRRNSLNAQRVTGSTTLYDNSLVLKNERHSSHIWYKNHHKNKTSLIFHTLIIREVLSMPVCIPRNFCTYAEYLSVEVFSFLFQNKQLSKLNKYIGTSGFSSTCINTLSKCFIYIF